MNAEFFAAIEDIEREKGIPKDLWEEALSQIPEMGDAIDKFLHQKLRGKEADDKTVKKVVDALLRRGHGWQEIRAGLQRYQSELELPEGGLEDFE